VPYLSLIKYAIPFVLGVAITLLYHSNAMRGVEIEQLEADRQRIAEIARIKDENQKNIAAIDEKYTAELASAVAAVPPVAERVYIRAKCPRLPAASGAGVDQTTRAELDADHRQLVHDLRQGALRMKAKLDACQAVLK
jgi:hypothetical protein